MKRRRWRSVPVVWRKRSAERAGCRTARDYGATSATTLSDREDAYLFIAKRIAIEPVVASIFALWKLVRRRSHMLTATGSTSDDDHSARTAP